MGNSESQYSIQGPRGSSIVLPGRQKPFLKFRSTKEESVSPHGCWRVIPGTSAHKSKAVGHGCLSQQKGTLPYVPRHYDYIAKGVNEGGNGGPWKGSHDPLASEGHLVLSSENGYGQYEDATGNGRLNGYMMNGHKTPERKPCPESLEEQSSPRVVIKKDGSLRVEFTNNSTNSPLLLDECAGPVQLLKFSPNVDSTPSLPGVTRRHELHHGAPTATSSTTRTSKGSSLSSEGSWYDSPWGTGAELNEADSLSPSRVGGSTGDSQSRVLDEQLLPELYRDPTMAVTFNTIKDLPLRYPDEMPTKHRASFVSVMEVPTEEECPEVKQYASYTLPCRKPRPVAEDAVKKESIRNRMRRLSDWTGSLTRKKRKMQESRYKDPNECFDSGVDGLTADTSSPSQVSSLLWYPRGPSQPRSRSRSQALPSRSESAGALNQGTDALRQNIYENFMRELEAGGGRSGGGRGGGGGGRLGGGSEERQQEPSTEGTEDSSSEETLGSLEQLDLLFEKEQGVVRRAGWLSFKPLITLHKDRKLELVSRRKWKHYWVTLKGCTLLFYETYGKSSSEQDLSPRYALIAEDSIVQAVPEHPKRENVFCLSNTYGDVYLFQASNQTDLENWVTAIHSASASLFAKRHGKEDTLRLLRGQIRGLLQKIDMDSKMRKMAELQLSIVSDPKNRKAIENQIQQWEQNLERFNMDLFRMRCYLASLQGGELPNPKSLLATASRPSKAALGRLGIFSVSSFHALICSRDEATLRKRSLSVSQRGRSKRGLFSSLKGLDNLTRRGREKRPSASQLFESETETQVNYLPPYSSERLDSLANLYSIAPPEGGHWNDGGESQSCVYMPDNQAVTLPLRQDHMVADALSLACKAKHLEPSLHFLRLRRCVGQCVEVCVPEPDELLQDLVYEELEVCPLNVFTLHMTRPSSTADYGFAVTGHVDVLSKSRIFVSEVLPDGLAFGEGLRPGDEILVLNGRAVSSLDLSLIQKLFAEHTLQLTLRRDPPSHKRFPDDTTLSLNPSHAQNTLQKPPRAKSSTDVSTVQEGPGTLLEPSLENGLHHRRRSHQPVQHSKSVETVCTLYHSFQEGSGGLMEGQKEAAGPEPTLLRPCPRHMSATERLRKVIQELVDTEKSYVKDLSCLFEIYLKPLQKETFLTQDEMESLFGSLPEMLDFQRVFLQTLEERIASSPDFSTLETPMQFKKLLFSLGGSFLYYADHFKLYSGFCANHIKVQKVLERAKTDQAFKEFLDARNPTKQHSSTLESYLIKPVQRVLKYPLLLRELVSLTDADSEEHYHLTEALKAMEKVASHINEMQKIYEDYGTVFDQLVAEQSSAEKEVTEISMGEFLMHSSVIWLNPLPSLGRMRKDPELTVFVFKKAVILVYRDNNKLKKKSGPRSSHGDTDPFKFRWLIPRSSLQVRLGNSAGSETSCIWELIHTKSEIEGRPETVFQLCSSIPENKVNIIKVIRSVLRENVRRNMPSDRACRERLTPLRSTLPSSARLGSSRASWLCRLDPPSPAAPHTDVPSRRPADSDEASLSSGAPSDGRPPKPAERLSPPSPSSAASSLSPCGSASEPLKESDILSDEDEEFAERLSSGRSDSPPSAIEAQFRQLRLSEEQAAARAPAPCVQPEGGEVDTPERRPPASPREPGPGLQRAHFCPIKRKSGGSLRRSQGALLSMREHSRSLDSQADTAAVAAADLNSLLEREFSVQSLTSVVNEDCFYEVAESGDSSAATASS
ncbi:T-lymphoma invasion and metastasis-inducing protein 2 isoform X1 [Alosa sapidissima]|uniref:T-lymphoma invasion and metastasis-inducing protein 2 isoform X1 n=2 Tax=Alosa sapidissima TaxID=34773 RepID=UPI001C0888B4|nr:T-lymphoma invasion and metastasis-inducing protein 2 isoform X1 [Alosa sapidissima]XP_041928952.1 T-lymphoma invasion and metastasis-inducing protein 2 isoform X1 [Alosa sapidissima]